MGSWGGGEKEKADLVDMLDVVVEIVYAVGSDLVAVMESESGVKVAASIKLIKRL